MTKKSTHHRRGDPRYNNPAANRFDKLPPKPIDDFSRIAYVLQGGGSLGIYQMGVVKGLLEAGYEPDWISATSIGAIQAAIIVGNKPNHRIAKLEEFWDRVATYTPFDILGEAAPTQHLYNQLLSISALGLGQRGFFSPRWSSPFLQIDGTPSTLSFYDTSPLKQTLLDLIDFDLLNTSLTRLSLGSVQISTGNLVYFNNINYCIGPEHIMASGALPPGFPAIEIDSEYYWDGGVHSNTPLEVILDAEPPANTLCFVIDCFGGTPFIPSTMNGVAERRKDIAYSTHAYRSIKNYIEKQNLQITLQKLTKVLRASDLKLVDCLIEKDNPSHQTLVHIAYNERTFRSVAKDFDFGQVTLKERMAAGYKDVNAVLKESSKWAHLPEDLNCRLYEAPHNLSQLMRVDKE